MMPSLTQIWSVVGCASGGKPHCGGNWNTDLRKTEFDCTMVEEAGDFELLDSISSCP
jgi:hypothetical protein